LLYFCYIAADVFCSQFCFSSFYHEYKPSRNGYFLIYEGSAAFVTTGIYGDPSQRTINGLRYNIPLNAPRIDSLYQAGVSIQKFTYDITSIADLMV
jgi:hypothetical protein